MNDKQISYVAKSFAKLIIVAILLYITLPPTIILFLPNNEYAIIYIPIIFTIVGIACILSTITYIGHVIYQTGQMATKYKRKTK